MVVLEIHRPQVHLKEIMEDLVVIQGVVEQEQ
jgi:hypothetical protein